MQELEQLSERIAALRVRIASEPPSIRLAIEIEDLLAEGYLCALRCDHRSRGLQERLDALVAAASGAEERRTIAHERRMVANATRELRSQLAVMHELWMSLGPARLGGLA